jgi:hypothetical protein
MDMDPHWKPSPDDEDFWQLVEMGAPGDCWPMKPDVGSVGKYGHRRIWFRGRREYAHRIAYRLVHGEIPDGMCVTHGCDEGSCASPFCLTVDSIAGNNAQRDARNRRTPRLPRGSQHWSAKLSDQSVIAIRRARGRVGAKLLADLYETSVATVYNCWSRRHYPEVA